LKEEAIDRTVWRT